MQSQQMQLTEGASEIDGADDCVGELVVGANVGAFRGTAGIEGANVRVGE